MTAMKTNPAASPTTAPASLRSGLVGDAGVENWIATCHVQDSDDAACQSKVRTLLKVSYTIIEF